MRFERFFLGSESREKLIFGTKPVDLGFCAQEELRMGRENSLWEVGVGMAASGLCEWSQGGGAAHSWNSFIWVGSFSPNFQDVGNGR